MHTIAHITDPCLQGRGVVFLHACRVRDDDGCAGDGGPGAGHRVQEGHVDFLRVSSEVHSLPKKTSWCGRLGQYRRAPMLPLG